MILKGMPELIDIGKFREKVLCGKMQYCEENDLVFKGVGQIELEIGEVLERVYEKHPDYPYVLVREEGDSSAERQKAELNDGICSGKVNDCYYIFCPWGLPIVIGRFTGFIFRESLSEGQRKMMEEKGIKIPDYQKSIYEYPAFQRFKDCKAELSNYIHTLSVWFVSLHEFGHIINGHIDLMDDVRNGEVDITKEQRKALELHADMTAANLLTEVISSWQKYVGVMRREVHLNGTNPGITYCDEISFAALAAYLSLRCYLPDEDKKWDEYTIGLHLGNSATHPLTQLRLAVVFNCLLDGLLEIAQTEEERGIFSKNFIDMVTQFEDFLFQNENAEDREKLFYTPTELMRTEKGKEYFQGEFDALMELNDILEKYTETLLKIEGEWIDYQTLPEKIFDVES